MRLAYVLSSLVLCHSYQSFQKFLGQGLALQLNEDVGGRIVVGVGQAYHQLFVRSLSERFN